MEQELDQHNSLLQGENPVKLVYGRDAIRPQVCSGWIIFLLLNTHSPRWYSFYGLGGRVSVGPGEMIGKGCYTAAAFSGRPQLGCMMDISRGGEAYSFGPVSRAVSQAEGRLLHHYMPELSQGAGLAEFPKLRSTFDFSIYRLMHMRASALLNFLNS
jgi:hypothetical protein